VGRGRPGQQPVPYQRLQQLFSGLTMRYKARERPWHTEGNKPVPGTTGIHNQATDFTATVQRMLDEREEACDGKAMPPPTPTTPTTQISPGRRRPGQGWYEGGKLRKMIEVKVHQNSKKKSAPEEVSAATIPALLQEIERIVRFKVESIWTMGGIPVAPYSVGMSHLTTEIVVGRKDEPYVERGPVAPPPVPEDAESNISKGLAMQQAEFSPYRRLVAPLPNGPTASPAFGLPPPSPRGPSGSSSSENGGPTTPRRAPSPRRSTLKSREAAAAATARLASPMHMKQGHGRDIGASPPRWNRKAQLPPEARAPSPLPRSQRPGGAPGGAPSGAPGGAPGSTPRFDKAERPPLPEDAMDATASSGVAKPSPLAKPVPRSVLKGNTSARLTQGMWSDYSDVRRGAVMQ